MSFRFIPAAINYSLFGCLGVYVSYKRRKGKHITVREKRPDYLWVDCPDRELVIVRNANHDDPFGGHPTTGTYDEFVDLSLYGPDLAHAYGVDIIMANAHHSPADDRRLRVGRPRRKGSPEILIDSGGFQLITQKLNYIDPVELVQHYNREADVGMSLDIPIIRGDKALTLRSARAQARNNELMMRHKVPELELMNVFHGGSSYMDEFRKIVERPDIRRVAIAGTADGNTLVSALEMLWRARLKGQAYKQYHNLGIYNIAHMLPTIYTANTEQFKGRLITSDASTPVQNATEKRYHHQANLTAPPRLVPIGDRVTYPSVNNLLPCHCPVCASIKYVDVLSILDGAATRHVLAVHNVLEIARYSNQMDELARTISFTDFRDVCKAQLVNSQAKGMALQALDFTHHLSKHGLDSAINKFAAFRTSTTEYKSPTDMFGVTAQVDDGGINARNEKYAKYLDQVLTKYETDGYKEKTKKIQLKKGRHSGGKRVSTKTLVIGKAKKGSSGLKSIADVQDKRDKSKAKTAERLARKQAQRQAHG